MRYPFERLCDAPASQQTPERPEPEAPLGHAARQPIARAAGQRGARRQPQGRRADAFAVDAEPAAARAGWARGIVPTHTERVRLRLIQAPLRLADLLLYEGPIDGMLNVETVAALRHFQTLKGLRESGQATAATLRALGVPTGP